MARCDYELNLLQIYANELDKAFHVSLRKPICMVTRRDEHFMPKIRTLSNCAVIGSY